jgi:hypothetical protein
MIGYCPAGACDGSDAVAGRHNRRAAVDSAAHDAGIGCAAVPRTMGPFALVMTPLASQAACAELAKASNVIASFAARLDVGMTAATIFASTVLAGTRASTFPRIWVSFGQPCLRPPMYQARRTPPTSSAETLPYRDRH